MTAYDYIGKSKLAHGFSYPISRTVVDSLFDTGALTNVTGLAFVGPSDDFRLLCARYSARRSRNKPHTLTLWINAVPSLIRQRLHDLLICDGMAALSAWASQFTDTTLAYSQLDHNFTITYTHTSKLNDPEPNQCTLKITQDDAHIRKSLGRYRANIRQNLGNRR